MSGSGIAGGELGRLMSAGVESFSSVLDKAYMKAVENDNTWGKRALEILSAGRRSFQQHPVGPQVESMISEGIRQRHILSDQYRKPITDFQKLVNKHSELASMHNYDKTPLRTIFQSVQPVAGQPINPVHDAANNALAPLMQYRSNHNRTINELIRGAEAKANITATQNAFGPDNSYLGNTLYPMFRSSQPTDRTLAESWLRIISTVFKDTRYSYDRDAFNRPTGTYREISGITQDVGNHINERRIKAGLDKVFFRDDPTYKKAAYGEHQAQNYTMTNLAPWISIIHLSDLVKLPANFGPGVLMKTLMSLNDPTIEALRVRSGVYNHTLHSIWDNDFRYRTGMISRYSDMPEAAAIFHKLWHQPGFNNLRNFQMKIFATGAYHAAQEWAWEAYHGERFAIEQLKDLDISEPEIQRQGGVLTTEQLEKAMFHFTNNQLFIDNPLERSRMAAASPWLRFAYLLHGYATREGRLMARTLYKAAVGGRFDKVAQWGGVVGVAFPYFVAPALKSLGVLARTFDPEAAGESLQTSYKKLLTPSTPAEWLYNYTDLAGHFAGIGQVTSLVHSAANLKLAGAIFGATPGMAVTIGQDWIRVGDDVLTGKNADTEFVKAMRDSIHYSIPVLGNPIQHYLYPIKKPQHKFSMRLPSNRRRNQ